MIANVVAMGSRYSTWTQHTLHALVSKKKKLLLVTFGSSVVNIDGGYYNRDMMLCTQLVCGLGTNIQGHTVFDSHTHILKLKHRDTHSHTHTHTDRHTHTHTHTLTHPLTVTHTHTHTHR